MAACSSSTTRAASGLTLRRVLSEGVGPIAIEERSFHLWAPHSHTAWGNFAGKLCPGGWHDHACRTATSCPPRQPSPRVELDVCFHSSAAQSLPPESPDHDREPWGMMLLQLLSLPLRRVVVGCPRAMRVSPCPRFRTFVSHWEAKHTLSEFCI